MNNWCVLLMLVCLSVSQVTSSFIPIDDQPEGPLLDYDGQLIDIPDITTAATPTECKGEFRRLGEHCYHFSTDKATWDEASKACQSLDAALAHPNSLQEDAGLALYIQDHRSSIDHWWIGATDRDNEGQWVWSHDNSPVGFTNWLIGEPNNAFENEHCAQYNRRAFYKWNDSPCDNKYHYICQYVDPNDDSQSYPSGDGQPQESIPSTTETSVVTLNASKSDFTSIGGHRYFFSSTKATWLEASEACQSIDTHLAHPRDSQENSQLTHQIEDYESSATGWWFGANDRDSEGQWVWANDNTSVGYSDWLSGEPNDAYENEDCAHFRRDMDYKWNDAPCKNMYNFVCQAENENDDSSEESSSEEESGETEQCVPTAETAPKSKFTKVGSECYHFSRSRASFDDASKACLSLGAHFAHPDNQHDNTQLTNYIRNKYKHDPKGWWIGATDRDHEGQWVWVHDHSPVGYADWSVGESHESHEAENCAFYGRKSDYKWNDVPCENKYNYICQLANGKHNHELPSGEVETELEAEINDETIVSDATSWNCWSSAVIITCLITGNLFITHHHNAV